MGKKLGYLNGPNVNFAKKIIDANDVIFELGSILKFSLPFYKYFYVPKYSKLVENEKFIHRFVQIIICKRYMSKYIKQKILQFSIQN